LIFEGVVRDLFLSTNGLEEVDRFLKKESEPKKTQRTIRLAKHYAGHIA